MNKIIYKMLINCDDNNIRSELCFGTIIYTSKLKISFNWTNNSITQITNRYNCMYKLC